jgi:hypothetical protein
MSNQCGAKVKPKIILSEAREKLTGRREAYLKPEANL